MNLVHVTRSEYACSNVLRVMTVYMRSKLMVSDPVQYEKTLKKMKVLNEFGFDASHQLVVLRYFARTVI